MDTENQPRLKNFKLNSRLCSSRAGWPEAPNFCSRVTRKSLLFHRNHMLGTLDFTTSEHWVPFDFFLRAQPWNLI